jgi:hypothetical protein
MKTKHDLQQKIIEITNTVRLKFPELAKHIAEMPENNADEVEITIVTLEKYYLSLKDVLTSYATTHTPRDGQEKLAALFAAYPIYPPSEDIYNKFKEEKDLNPEDISKKKSSNEKPDTRNEKGFEDDRSGADLDVPGSELDDEQEAIGNEDEENNHYSIGGDNHNDLEENKG